MILSTLYGLLFAFLRRWYGGGYENTWLGNNRGLQTTVMCLTMYPIFFLLNKNLVDWNLWIIALIALVDTLYVQFEFWSRGHGPCFDEGRGTPDENTIKRYNKRWYHIPCDYLFDKIFKEPDKKYGFLYDFLYMGMRYTMPMILMMLASTKFLIIGLLVSPIYAICWTISERDNWVFKKFRYVSSATNLAEYLTGFVFGFGLMLITLLSFVGK